MPFNKKRDADNREPEFGGYLEHQEARPAPQPVDIRELPNGIVLVQLSNGLYIREDCQHWVREPYGLKPNCRFDCPSPAELERQIIGRLQGVL